jgi:hypothetical protein
VAAAEHDLGVIDGGELVGVPAPLREEATELLVAQ